ncbi:MAG: hypothetical protein QXD44_05720 [Candidatus Nezhaarchaeales archaeon]
MGGGAELTVAEPIKGDVGVVRLDRATMTYLGVKPGDYVTVVGELLSYAHVKARVEEPLPEDEGKAIIRLAADKMLEGGFVEGMRVIVYKSWLKTLMTSLIERHKKVPIKAPKIIPREETTASQVNRAEGKPHTPLRSKRSPIT